MSEAERKAQVFAFMVRFEAHENGRHHRHRDQHHRRRSRGQADHRNGFRSWFCGPPSVNASYGRSHWPHSRWLVQL